MNTIDNDAVDSANFTLKPSPEVNARVRESLNEKLAQYGTDCESLYITTVNDPVALNVTFSQDLNALGNDTLEWGVVQSHNTGLTGIFSASHTFDEASRVGKPGIYEVEAIMQELLDEAKYKWNA